MHDDSCNSKRCVVVDLLVAALLLLLQCWTGARESATSPRIQRSERLARQCTATARLRTCNADATTTRRLNWRCTGCCAHAAPGAEGVVRTERHSANRPTTAATILAVGTICMDQVHECRSTGGACRRRGLVWIYSSRPAFRTRRAVEP
jgi:hypothetical protein